MTSEENGPESKWPGVDLAYELAKSSYEVAYQRLDNINARMQSLLTYTATITLAAPVIVRSIEAKTEFDSVWFVGAMVFFVLNAMVGPVLILVGSVKALAPRVMYEKWLEYSPWEFKKNAIYFAAEHFEVNSRLVNRKGMMATAMTVAFLAESVCLVLWAASQI